jgi:hypothetical protein
VKTEQKEERTVEEIKKFLFFEGRNGVGAALVLQVQTKTFSFLPLSSLLSAQFSLRIQSSKMPKYKVNYFNTMGTAESMRLGAKPSLITAFFATDTSIFKSFFKFHFISWKFRLRLSQGLLTKVVQ